MKDIELRGNDREFPKNFFRKEGFIQERICGRRGDSITAFLRAGAPFERDVEFLRILISGLIPCSAIISTVFISFLSVLNISLKCWRILNIVFHDHSFTHFFLQSTVQLITTGLSVIINPGHFNFSRAAGQVKSLSVI